MAALYVIEILIAIAIAWGIIFQLLIPIAKGDPLFPILRRERRMQDHLAEAQELERIRELQNKIKDIITSTKEKPNGKPGA